MSTPMPAWTLAHKWRSASDLAALALCAQTLAASGIRYADTREPDAADAVKMHAQALVDAVRDGFPPLADLAAVARQAGWAERLKPAAWRFMRHGERVHGIPVGIHRSNGWWANQDIVRRVRERTGSETVTLVQWLREAAKDTPKPLLVASGSWPAAVLFESVCLAVAGESVYRAAFERLDPDALGGAAMVEALAKFGALGEFVDDGRRAQPWDVQFDGLRRGEGAAIVMGDWVTARLPEEIEPLALADAGACDALVVDYFVPLARGDAEVAEIVATALTTDAFQEAFGRVKGCASVLVAHPAAQGRPSVPSLAFEQCCSVAKTQAFVDLLADHFREGRSERATARALADIATR